jgi:parallel beta-helix repeat protein
MTPEDIFISFISLNQLFRVAERMRLLRKTVSGIMLTLLLIGMLALSFNIQPVKTEPAVRIDNLIITTPDLEAAASRLAQWKNSCGIPSLVLNLTSIDSHYTGVDEPEKIRNCIKDYHSNFQTKYVTIFGDADKVPTRYVYVPDEYDNFTATDLYYADLNGTWDDNGDGLYADQRYDYVDGIPDVYVGRIPVSLVDYAQVIVNKIEAYQQQFDISQNWTRRIVLAAGTGNNGIEDTLGNASTVLNEYIANITRNKEVVKLYESAGNLSTASMGSEIDKGALFVNFVGHGGADTFPIIDTGWLFYWILPLILWNGFGRADIQSTTNGARLPVVTTCSCLTAKFDDDFPDCFGEWFVGHPTGGAIAYFGSTRVAYSWPNRSAPHGLMGEIDRRIYENFYEGFTRLGQMWGETVTEYVEQYVQDYRNSPMYDAKTIMEFILLGDPTLRIYNGPETLKVPDEYATIQGAINSAYAGDTIYVRAGTYFENIVVNKTVSLVGEDKNKTIVDGCGNGTIFTITRNNVKIANFTIQNSEPKYYLNAGIYIENNVTNCNITKTNVRNNVCGILVIFASNNSISDNTIVNNTDGFLLWSARGNTIIGNNITNNQHGLTLDEASENLIFYNNFIDNTYQVGIATPMLGYVNFWDDGYPSGGNYWSDYNGTDLFSGIYQNQTANDGISDKPHIIFEDNRDYYPLMNPYPCLHAIAVNAVRLPKTIRQGFSTEIQVDIVNQGHFIETFNATVYANTTIIQTQNIAISAGNSLTITFRWNTTGFDKGNYAISANAGPVSGETDITDNTYTRWIVVTILADLNGDGVINIVDIAIVARAFGTKPGDVNWNPEADLNNDGVINIIDIAMVAKQYGKTV